MFLEFEEGEKHKKGLNPECSDNLDAFTDAGYILENSEIVVDIDHLPKDSIQAMMDTFDINTQIVWTERGAHLYFKKPKGWRKADGITALGFPVEYKTSANTEAVTVKLNGVARQIDNEGLRQDLPECLKWERGYQDLCGLQEGDERNKKLYKHKARIHKLAGYKRYLHFINKHVFEVPLSDKEFETVSRDEQFLTEKGQQALVADMIMRECRAVKHLGTVYLKIDGIYTGDPDQMDREIFNYCPPGSLTSFVEEVKKQIHMRCDLIPNDKVFEIKFKNGFLYKGEFVPCNFEGFTPYTIDIEYDPEAEPVEVVDDYLDQLTKGDDDYKKRLLEILGHCLITDKEFKRMLAKFFIFVGGGGNGKGTLLQVIRKILGPENISALSISNMKDERYLSQLKGKLANLGDDIQDEPINNKEMKILKNLSTCDTIEIKRLYENPVTMEVSASLIFTSNHQIKSFEKGESYKRRVDWLPMYTQPEKKDPKFISKLTTPEALKYWIRLIMEGYMRLYENEDFTFSQVVYEFNEEYHRENNNTLLFVEELTDSEIDGKKPADIFEDYKSWAEENGYSALSKKQLYATIELERGFKSKKKTRSGNSVRVFSKVD